MSTGYTHNIAKGISFEEFIMNCARAFGALITMRDESADAKIPEKFEPNAYHKGKLHIIEKELVKIKLMSIKQATQESDKEYALLLESNEDGIREANKLRQQYNDMLAKVVLWQPPTSGHQGLKDFMEQQIIDSIKFDCDTSYYVNKKIPILTGTEWKTKRIQQLLKDLVYHTKENTEEIKRAIGRTEWVRKLRLSII